MDGKPFHGKNSYIYLSGIAVVGANSWSINESKDVVETPQFGDTWKVKAWGMRDATGSLNTWKHADKRTVIDCIAADGPVSLYIYPDRGDATNFVYGMVVFTGSAKEGSTTSAVSETADFTTCDNSGLTWLGWS